MNPPTNLLVIVKNLTLALTAGMLALLGMASNLRADEPERSNRRGPDLPSPACDSVEVPPGHRLSTHLYALGVQIYRWTGTAWEFVAPEAELFGDPCYQGSIGIHYAGPTWETHDGSKVVAVRQTGCAPFRGAIPWLRLGVTESSPRGRLARVTHIQRVNTIGGTAPGEPGTFIGEEARVPYTAEYYFYRANRD